MTKTFGFDIALWIMRQGKKVRYRNNIYYIEENKLFCDNHTELAGLMIENILSTEWSEE